MVIMGAGGHAKVVIDQVQQLEIFDLVGCVARHEGGEPVGIPIIGDERALPALRAKGVRYAFPAVGSIALRVRFARLLTALGFELASIVSPSAVVSKYARLGKGVVVMPGAVVQADTF